MRYTSIRDVRSFNGWYPIAVVGESASMLSDTLIKTQRRPIVDFDWDGDLLDDVVVYVDGAQVGVASVDAERGEISLASPAPQGSVITCDYYWHPVGDGEISLAIEAAEAEIDATAGMRFDAHTRSERIKLHHGSELSLSAPIISIQSVKVYDQRGALIDSAAEYEVLDAESGLIRLLRHSAGRPAPPWYLTRSLEVEVSYTAGYQQVPESVRNAAILIASYWLALRVGGRIVFGDDYGEALSVGFSSEDLSRRLRAMREEVERVKKSLPRRVARS